MKGKVIYDGMRYNMWFSSAWKNNKETNTQRDKKKHFKMLGRYRTTNTNTSKLRILSQCCIDPKTASQGYLVVSSDEIPLDNLR